MLFVAALCALSCCSQLGFVLFLPSNLLKKMSLPLDINAEKDNSWILWSWEKEHQASHLHFSLLMQPFKSQGNEPYFRSSRSRHQGGLRCARDRWYDTCVDDKIENGCRLERTFRLQCRSDTHEERQGREEDRVWDRGRHRLKFSFKKVLVRLMDNLSEESRPVQEWSGSRTLFVLIMSVAVKSLGTMLQWPQICSNWNLSANCTSHSRAFPEGSSEKHAPKLPCRTVLCKSFHSSSRSTHLWVGAWLSEKMVAFFSDCSKGHWSWFWHLSPIRKPKVPSEVMPVSHFHARQY